MTSLDPSPARARVHELIRRTLTEVTDGRPASETLFGPGGTLDSLGLVNFLADLEYRLSEEFGRHLVLASDRAMSRERSPFRTVDALTDYVVELLGE